MDKRIIENIEDVVNIQKSSGNWDYDPYMHGLLNGMLFIQSFVSGESFDPYDAPKRWTKKRLYERIINKITGKNNPIAMQK